MSTMKLGSVSPSLWGRGSDTVDNIQGDFTLHRFLRHFGMMQCFVRILIGETITLHTVEGTQTQMLANEVMEARTHDAQSIHGWAWLLQAHGKFGKAVGAMLTHRLEGENNYLRQASSKLGQVQV